MPVVGAFARVDLDVPGTRERLEELEGCETFALDEPGKVGLVLEADDLDGAHALLTGDVRRVRGVLGVWPVSVHLETEEDE